MGKMMALKIKSSIKISAVKKAASILRVRKRGYTQVMTITCAITKTTNKREVTPEELVESMYKQ